MIDILITTYNRCKLLKQTIESLVENTKMKYRLWISDDCSPDGTPAYLESLRLPSLNAVILNKKRRGIVYGFDQLWNSVDMADQFNKEFPYMCYLQDDCAIKEDDWLFTLIKAYEELRDKHKIGFFSGYDATDHPFVEKVLWRGREILLKKSSRATNLIAEKSFWRSIGYVPKYNPDGTERGFPNARRGSNIDLYWTGCYSGSRYSAAASAPNSSYNQGKMVMVIPGMIEHMAEYNHSTWRAAAHA